MLTVIYCTRETKPKHKEHLIKSSGLHKHIEVIEIINNNNPNSKYYNGGESLTHAYNRGLKQAKYKHVVFCHDDIIIETKQWGPKLLKQFEKNPEFGIIGVAGSKNMPVSGQWWEDRKQMYGRVAHTHEGKTWLSSYSDDLGQTLEEVITIDGVFFAVDITKLETKFNEKVEGFHFYDVTFCFENYLKGGKIGVSTLIRVNHQSIGITNEQWEANRVIFAENFKENLPVNIKKTTNHKLKIMFASMNLSSDNVREKMMLEMAIALKKKGHDVTITSTTGGPMDKIANKNNIKLFHIMEPPGFKLGDGKWQVQTPNGLQPSIEKSLYKIKSTDFDVMHVLNDEIIDHFKKIYPDNPIVNTNFSDGLFVQNIENEKVNKTITLKTDLAAAKTDEFVEKLVTDYIEVL